MSRIPLLVTLAAICALLVSSASTQGARVSADNAGVAARGFIVERFPADNALTAGTRTAAGNSALEVSQVVHLEKGGEVLAYVVRLAPQGFVLLSTDDEAPPVKLYSSSGSYENLPPAFRAIVEQEMLEDLAVLAAAKTPPAKSAAGFSGQWTALLDSAPAQTLDGDEPNNAGMTLVTTAWDQGDPYNYYCPAAGGGPGGKAWAGCNATALAQILRHHRQPVAVLGDHYYTDSSGLCTGTRALSDVGLGAYDWANMPLSLSTGSPTAEKQAVGRLIYHCAVSLDTNFEASGSSADPVNVPDALRNLFSYTCSDYRWKSGYSSSAWYNLIAADVDLNHPVLYAMWQAGETNGHVVVCDGYRNGNEIHLNMGWSGSDDAWYNIDSVSTERYTWTVHGGVFSIIAANYTLDLAGSGSGSVKVNSVLRTLPWSGTFTVGSTVTLEAVPDSGMQFVGWSGDLSGSANPTSIVMNGYKSVTASFSPPYGSLRVTLAPRGAVTAGGAWRRIGTSTWYGSGSVEAVVPVGSHTVEFKDLPGWTKPANIAGISVSEGALTSLSAAYAMTPQIIIGTGTETSWRFPLNTNYEDARTQSIYLASEIGGPRTVTGLALDVTTIPGMPMSNFTIRMKPTALSNYNSSMNFEPAGWTTVYQANQTVSTTGWVQFNFTMPYNFNYTDGNNVMVDISFNNSYWRDPGICRTTATPEQVRVIYDLVDSTAGDPLTWSGQATFYALSIPNIRLTVVPHADANRDFNVNFTDFAVIASKWLQTNCTIANQWCSWADINRSGAVNYADIFELANHWLD